MADFLMIISNKKLGLSLVQQQKLGEKFSSAGRFLSSDELSQCLEVDESRVIAILLLLDTGGFCETKLIIFHTCSEAPAALARFGVGFPSLPWTCPRCSKVTHDINDLSFDVGALVLQSVKFTTD